MLAGCSSILGIDDPTPAGGGPDGGNPDGPDGPRELTSISIAPDPLALPLGVVRPIMAIGTFSDGSTEDLTAQATFSRISGDALDVSPQGMVRALAQGAATIQADAAGFTDTIDATVGPPAPASIMLSLGNITLMQQQRAQVRASIIFTDGSRQDGTNSVTWDTDEPAIATVVTGQIDAQLASGDATITASLPNVPPVSIVATVSVIACHPVINEAQSGGNLGASEEWAEIYNPCTVAIDVEGWTLNYRASTATGASDTNGLITLTGAMQPGEIRLFGANAAPSPNDGEWGGGVMQQNNGALALRSGPTSAGPIVDSMAYGVISAGHPFVENQPAPGLVNDRSVQRLPFDGNDTNANDVNFVQVLTPSPRALNVP